MPTMSAAASRAQIATPPDPTLFTLFTMQKAWVENDAIRRLNHGTYRVLHLLLNLANSYHWPADGALIVPRAGLAAVAGVHRSGVKRHLEELARAGLLTLGPTVTENRAERISLRLNYPALSANDAQVASAYYSLLDGASCTPGTTYRRPYRGGRRPRRPAHDAQSPVHGSQIDGESDSSQSRTTRGARANPAEVVNVITPDIRPRSESLGADAPIDVDTSTGSSGESGHREGDPCPRCGEGSLRLRWKTLTGSNVRSRFLACDRYRDGCEGYTEPLDQRRIPAPVVGSAPPSEAPTADHLAEELPERMPTSDVQPESSTRVDRLGAMKDAGLDAVFERLDRKSGNHHLSRFHRNTRGGT